MRFPVRRVLFGFVAGAAAGWAAGLLRRPATAPAGSSADEAIHLPREDFGVAEDEPTPTPAHAPPRKATAPAVRTTPGTRKPPIAREGSAEPAKPTAALESDATPAAAAEPAPPPAKPARKRAARKKAAPDPVEAVAAPLREGRAELTERLAGAEADATPPPAPDPGPARRRRRVKPEA